MSRKKATKKSKLKNTAAKTAGKNATRTLEKSITGIPAKLISQCKKELNGYRSQEKKLLAALNKATAKQDTTDAKIETLTTKAQTKPTTSTKKQLKATQRTLAAITNTITTLTKQLEQVQQITTTLGLKQDTYANLQKLVTSYDKEWDVKHKVAGFIAKKRTKKTKKTLTNTTPTGYDTNVNQGGMLSDTEIETIE